MVIYNGYLSIASLDETLHLSRQKDNHRSFETVSTVFIMFFIIIYYTSSSPNQ
jgi:hypothetical protein